MIESSTTSAVECVAPPTDALRSAPARFDPRSGFASINPATGELLQDYCPHDLSEAAAILGAVHAAQRSWMRRALSHRASQLSSIGAALLHERHRLARLIATEMGKPVAQAVREIEKCAAWCEHLAVNGAAPLAPELRAGARPGSQVLHVARGVLLAVMPWNFPFWQILRVAAPALLAGNTVLLKPAPNVPGCAFALETLIASATGTPDLLRVTLAGRAAVARLIAEPRVGMVAFTGSSRAGRRIAALAGAALKPGSYELGGSDPYLVLEDADLDHTVTTLAAARLANAGQTCVSPKRLIVHERVAAEFEQRLIQAFRTVRSGDPLDPATGLGPLARSDLRQRVQQLVQSIAASGARIVMGGRIPSGPGYFYPPTILADVRPHHPAAQAEVFGPVALICRVADEDEAVAAANASPFGLGAGVFTRDPARGARIATELLDAGMVCVNGCVRSDPCLPFGGTKASGYGRELGLEGLRAVTHTKTLTFG